MSAELRVPSVALVLQFEILWLLFVLSSYVLVAGEVSSSLLFSLLKMQHIITYTVILCTILYTCSAVYNYDNCRNL